MTARIRRGLAIGAFLVLALGFLAATHGYLALRLVLDPGWPEPARSLGIAALVVLAALIVAHPIAERALPRPLARFVSWPAALWMGAFFWLLLLSLASDVLLWTAGGVARAADASAPGEGAAALRAVLALSITGVASRRGCAPGWRRRRCAARSSRSSAGRARSTDFASCRSPTSTSARCSGASSRPHLAQRVNALAPISSR